MLSPTAQEQKRFLSQLSDLGINCAEEECSLQTDNKDFADVMQELEKEQIDLEQELNKIAPKKKAVKPKRQTWQTKPIASGEAHDMD